MLNLDRGEVRDLGVLVLERATGRVLGSVQIGGGLNVDPRTIRLGVDTGPAIASIDLSGTFSLDGVYAGERTVTASLSGFTSATARVTVTAERPVNAPVLLLEPVPVPLEVLVGTPAGFAAGDTPLAIVASMDGQAQTVPVVDGAARFNAPREGLLSLTVSHPALARFERTVQIAPGDDSDATVALTPIRLVYAQGGLRGQVDTADCAPTGVVVLVTATGQLTGATAAMPVLIPGADTGGCGRGAAFEMSGLRADDYLLTFTAEAYRPGVAADAVEVREETFAPAAPVVLEVNPGSIRGVVRYADRAGPQDEPISISLSGMPEVFQAEADGSFVLPDLRAGIYSVTFNGSAEGYRPVTVSPVVVAAGAETQMAETALPIAYGAVTGTLALEHDDELSEVVVTLTHADGEVHHTLVGANGEFSFDAVRTGTYTASARHPLYVEAQEAGISVALDQTARLAFSLNLHRGALRGVARPSDTGPEALTMTVTLQQTGESRVASAAGDFEFADLRPGVYTVSVEGDGHRTAQSLPVTVGPGETVTLEEVLILVDETAPDAPVLVACDKAEPLPDFPDSPVVIPVAADTSAPYSVRLGLANDPTEDANFDPAAGLGSWQGRVNGGHWLTLAPEALVRGGPDDACGDHFVVPVDAADTVRTLEIRAEDADGNRSDSGLIVALVDADAPTPFTLAVPQSQCNMVAPAANAPQVLLPEVRRDGTPTSRVQRDAVPLCHTSADTVELLITPPPKVDPTFGCYFVYSRQLDVAMTVEEIQGELLDDSGAIDLENRYLDTTACYRSGAQSIAVSPRDGQRTLYCVVGLDQSGRYAPFAVPDRCANNADCGADRLCNPRTHACETPIGRKPDEPDSMLGCLVINRDTAAPQSVDLLPDGNEITGGLVRLHTVGLPASRDPHFARLEFRGGLYGANWRGATAELSTFSDRGVLSLRVPMGQPSTLAIRAVDLAGNESDETLISVEDVTQRPVADDGKALGSSPAIVGERTAWIGPPQCDPQGFLKTCSHVIRIRDENQLVPTVTNLGSLQSCAYDCVTETTRTPKLVMLPRGLAYTHYVVDANNAPLDARLMYRSFGPDALPNTADDPVATEMGGANTVFEGVVALAANERQVAYATVTEPDRNVRNNETYVVRRFTVNELDGAADPEQTLAELPGRATITSAVVAVAPIAGRGVTPAGTAIALADGTAWWWPQGVAAATSLTLPAITAVAGATTRAMDLAGTARHLVVAAQAFADADGVDNIPGTADDGKPVDAPAVALLLDLGSNGTLDASERLTAPGLPCQADADCGAGVSCVRPVVEQPGACAIRIGYTDLRCAADRNRPFCGALQFDLAADADMLAYTDESLDADGLPTGSLYVARLGAGLTQPRLVVARQGHKSTPAVHLDRVAYVDEFTNAPVVTVADPSVTGWVGLDGRPKTSPRMGKDYVIWSSYSAGIPATLTADAAPTFPLDDATLLVTVIEDGRTIGRRISIADLSANATAADLAAMLNTGDSLRDNGRLFLRATVSNNRLVLTTERVGATVTLSVDVTGDPEHRFGFGANRIQSGGDVLDPASALFLSPVDGGSEPFTLTPGLGSKAAVAQEGWARGQHYDLAGSVLAAVELRRDRPPEVAFWALRSPTTCRGLDPPLEPAACVNATRHAIITYQVAGTSVTDIATDGRFIVWGVLGPLDEQGLWIYDTTTPAVLAARIPGSTQKCRLVGVTMVRPDGQNNSTVEVACISYQGADPAVKTDQYLTLYRKTGAQAWFGATTKVPPASGGLITGLLLDEYDLIVDRQEDGLIRTAYRSAGPDGLFGNVGAAGTPSDDLPDSDGVDNRFGNDDDEVPFETILGRFGEALGRGGLRRGVYVYADAAALGQREIYRLRLRGRQVDRLSADGSTQVQAAIGEGGVVFVDHRYTTTAAGRPIVPPALTVRQLP